jgi:Tol biopolymer transport system component
VVPAAGLAAFPGGNGEIAFNVCVACGSDAGYGAVHSVCPDGRRERSLKARLSSQDAAYSPDGRSLAFAVNRIYVARADGTKSRRVSSRVPGTYDSSPAWSPTRQSIAFARYDSDLGKSLIFVYRHGRNRVVTEGSDPTWSSRGEIAFTRAGDIHVIDPRSGRTRFVRSGQAPDGSPNGRRLVFVTDGGDLALMSSKGTGMRRLAHTRAREHSPVFSPDARWIAFHAKRGLYLRRVGGGRPHRVASGDGFVDVESPTSWRPLPTPSGGCRGGN